MDLQKALKLIESLGDCDELFVIGKQKYSGDYIYSCTEIKEALEFCYLLDVISESIKDSFKNINSDYDALDDILNKFDIDKNIN